MHKIHVLPCLENSPLGQIQNDQLNILGQSVINNQSITFNLIQLVLSADDLCKQFESHEARQNVRPHLDPNCLTL